MEMHQVRYFLALAETMNFTRAAERCHVSQPSLTRAIKGLEDELGGPLFHRERSRTHLTELGRLMQPYLAQVFTRADEAKSRARAYAKLSDSALSVGIMCTVGPERMLDLFRDFRERNPGVEVRCFDSTAKSLQDKLLSGALEVAIYGLPGPVEEQLHVLPLFEERFVVAMAPGHRLTRKNAVALKDLQGERYISRLNCEYWDYMTAFWEKQGVTVSVVSRSEREDWIQAMVAAGLGITYLPESAVTMPGIVTRPLIEPEVKRTVQLLTVRGRPHSPAVGAFVREAMGWRSGRDERPASRRPRRA